MDGLLFWKRLCHVLLALLVLQSLFLFQSRFRDGPTRSPQILTSTRPTLSPPIPQDSREVFTSDACDAEFPELYQEVDRAVAYWQGRHHNISAEDVEVQSWREDGAVRILIHDNELRILETWGTYNRKDYRMRSLSILSMLQRAIDSATAGGERLPTIEAAIIVDDISAIPSGLEDLHSVWTWTAHRDNRAHDRHWLIPDFGMYSVDITGSFAEARRRAIENDAAFEDKVPKAVWRGVTWTNEGVREPLVALARNQYWADVRVIDWKTHANIETMEHMCRYAFAIHTEGRSYSGRLQYLLNCDAVPIVHDLVWKGHFYHLLVGAGPHQNYIPVRRDWTDLAEKVKWYLDRPDDARRIVNNSLATFRNRYTTPAATSCYLRRLIRGYSAVSFTPEVHRPARLGEVRKRRGISYAEWLHLEANYQEET